MAAPGAADAKMARAAGAYDGVWNVVFATTRGTCSSGYSVPFTVTGSRVSSAGGGRVSGSVNRGGGVAVQVSVGASQASGGGRLAGNSGAGSWSGIIPATLQRHLAGDAELIHQLLRKSARQMIWRAVLHFEQLIWESSAAPAP